jgi:hypothetical protein
VPTLNGGLTVSGISGPEFHSIQFFLQKNSVYLQKILTSKLEMCKDKQSVLLKRVSDTRWSARADAVLAIKLEFAHIKEALNEICNAEEEKQVTIVEATSLLKKMDKYDSDLEYYFAKNKCY